MTLDVSNLRLFDASGLPGGNNDEWDLCSDGSHQGRNCHAVFFVAVEFCLDSGLHCVHVSDVWIEKPSCLVTIGNARQRYRLKHLLNFLGPVLSLFFSHCWPPLVMDPARSELMARLARVSKTR
jgi:hypothetical protein